MIRFMGLILTDPSLSEIFDEFTKVLLWKIINSFKSLAIREL